MVIIMITDPEIHSESTCCHLVIFTFLKSQSTFNENYLDNTQYLHAVSDKQSRSQWPHGLRHESAATCLLGLQVRIPLGARMSVSCKCCTLSGRGLCIRLPRPEESF